MIVLRPPTGHFHWVSEFLEIQIIGWAVAGTGWAWAIAHPVSMLAETLQEMVKIFSVETAVPLRTFSGLGTCLNHVICAPCTVDGGAGPEWFPHVMHGSAQKYSRLGVSHLVCNALVLTLLNIISIGFQSPNRISSGVFAPRQRSEEAWEGLAQVATDKLYP